MLALIVSLHAVQIAPAFRFTPLHDGNILASVVIMLNRNALLRRCQNCYQFPCVEM